MAAYDSADELGPVDVPLSNGIDDEIAIVKARLYLLRLRKQDQHNMLELEGRIKELQRDKARVKAVRTLVCHAFDAYNVTLVPLCDMPWWSQDNVRVHYNDVHDESCRPTTKWMMERVRCKSDSLDGVFVTAGAHAVSTAAMDAGIARMQEELETMKMNKS